GRRLRPSDQAVDLKGLRQSLKVSRGEPREQRTDDRRQRTERCLSELVRFCSSRVTIRLPSCVVCPLSSDSMAFFRTVSFTEPLPIIEGEGVFLRAPQMADYPEWATLREASRAFLTPWEPTWLPNDLTRGAFRRRLKRYAEDLRSDQAYPFFLFRRADNALVGGLTLANVRRGVAQAGSLGYWIGEPYARGGLMTAGVNALIPFVFDTLRLHRLEAACIPSN